MKEKGKRFLGIGSIFVVGFVIWTVLIQRVDVQTLGVNGTDIGFATINCWFHQLTGVHMEIYTITDWLGLVPIFICMIFGGIGCVQLMKGRSLFKVDYDIILLGIYYVLVVFGYLIFEMIPINYRPILIEGFMEASYPYERLIAAYQEARELNDEMEEKLDKPRTAKKCSRSAKFLCRIIGQNQKILERAFYSGSIISVTKTPGSFCRLIYPSYFSTTRLIRFSPCP